MLARKLMAPTAAGGGWSPSDLGSNLLAWYDAQDSGSITQSGGSVSQWNDLSGNGEHVVQGNAPEQPTYSATGFNTSYPRITFDGSDKLICAAFAGTSGAVLSIYAVGTLNSAASSYGRMVAYYTDAGNNNDFSGTDRAACILRDATNATVGAYRNNGLLSTKSISYDTPARFMSVFDGTNHTMYINNSAGTPVSSSTNFTTTSAALGIGQGQAGFWKGDICEIIIHKAADGSALRSDVDNYFKTRWGL
jgi:hypothetical protein